MKKLLAFYLLIICIDKAFAQSANEYDVQKDGGMLFQAIIIFIVFFGLVWIISKIVKSYSNKKKEIEKSQRSNKIQNNENGNGYINGHEYVDLGLSVMWASCNIGAKKPFDDGNYYAWGEIEPNWYYSEENSKTVGKDMGSIAGDPNYDAARANWDGTWRLPTEEEIDELVSKCKCEWTTQGGHNGYKVTGPNLNSIFLPATGQCSWPFLIGIEKCGNYWSATPNEDFNRVAVSLFFNSGKCEKALSSRDDGQSIRPVTE